MYPDVYYYNFINIYILKTQIDLYVTLKYISAIRAICRKLQINFKKRYKHFMKLPTEVF